jgi:hypothetical protein
MEVLMDTQSLIRGTLGAGLLASALVMAGCVAQADSDDPASETVGSASQSDLAFHATVPYPALQPTCSIVSDVASHNPEWPWHRAGQCGATPAFTFQDALTACGGAVNYFSYACADFGVDSAWTAYYGCCAPCSNGTGINLETRPFTGATGPADTQAAIALFYSLPVGAPGYGYDNALTSTASFSNHTSIPGGVAHDIAYHLRASIFVDLAHAGDWAFILAADFGFGGAILVDGQELVSAWFPHNEGDGLRPHSGGSCGDVTDLEQRLANHVVLGPGIHDIDVFGFENGSDCLYSPTGQQMRLEYVGAIPESGRGPISTSALQLCGR